jgi:hypothetical protein
LKFSIRGVAATVLALSLTAQAQDAQKVPVKAKDYRIESTTEAIRIDAVLDEPVWKTASPMVFDAETNPGDNVAPPAKTVGYMTYDRKYLYVAFECFDPDPKAIRAHLSDRDTAFSDDFVGVVLDTFNDNRRAFEFFVNPLGVQMDLIQDDTNRNEDSSWDAIWNTAGRITDEGYIVEMAIPFTSIRFPRTDTEQTWGVDMVRIYPRNSRARLGLQGQDRNRNCYLCQSSRVTGFRGITPGRDIELDPTITAQHTSTREDFPNGSLSSGGADIDAGLTARWGITPNLTLNAALNPDFSQIEADAVQLDINTQFALFFNEKRPFFLEGSDFFAAPLQVVYTRTLADPTYGLKTTGRLGKSTIGAFVAQDEVTNLIIPGPQESSVTSLDQENIASSFRYRYNVGETSSIGAMVTTRDGDDYSNRVYGLDGTFRIDPKNTIVAQLLGSTGEYPDSIVAGFDQPKETSDLAARFQYRHNSKHWYWAGIYEDIGEEFRADSGFIPQVGYRFGQGAVEYQGYGEKGKNFYTRYWVGGSADRSQEQNGDLLAQRFEAYVAGQGPMQSFAQIVIGNLDQRFNGVTFDQPYLKWEVEARPTGDLYVFLNGVFADQIDFANTQLGQRFRVAGGVQWNIGMRSKVNVDHSYEDLDVDGGRLFSAKVTQLRAVYQFNIRMFARAILQYTDITRDPALYRFETVYARSKRLFPQLLFSYKLNPQTVVFAGYSGTRVGGELDGIDVGLTEADRTFFVKLGYAWLF